MKCDIIKDLLPSYVDGLTSDESNREIENHIKDCLKCRGALEEMKSEIVAENIEVNKNDIKPFKKLNRKVWKAVLITLTCCILVAGGYLFLFGLGWGVQSDDIAITYTKNEEVITVNFELKDSQKALNNWGPSHEKIPHIKFTECYVGFLDDRGEEPNKFSYGIYYKDETGKPRAFTEEDYFVIQYRDKTEKLYWKDIAEELGVTGM
ncbi:zf-HC2 domain-containing protein [Desulfotomaculum sp. 1211_IL3151]|uniref:zf-HC2 domain-containing protein n=1 Tax=Desulfotomaculum sp. 1211_IL3151 TaxID=3084055 RepID=UPI002FD9C9A3